MFRTKDGTRRIYNSRMGYAIDRHLGTFPDNLPRKPKYAKIKAAEILYIFLTSSRILEYYLSSFRDLEEKPDPERYPLFP